MTHSEHVGHSELRRIAWDYFSVHASQRMAVFNFYVVLCSVVVTTYFASYKADSNLAEARPALAVMLCFFSIVFWKLDQRNKFLIKNAEAALKYFESLENVDSVAKVFSHEVAQTDLMGLKRWGWLRIWRIHLSYGDCFNTVFFVSFFSGLIGLAVYVYPILRAAFGGAAVTFLPCP